MTSKTYVLLHRKQLDGLLVLPAERLLTPPQAEVKNMNNSSNAAPFRSLKCQLPISRHRRLFSP
jgi:hypothetical protein